MSNETTPLTRLAKSINDISSTATSAPLWGFLPQSLNSQQNAMNHTNTIVKLSSDRRSTVMVAKSAKQRFDRLNSHKAYDWQFFDQLLDCYEQHGRSIASNTNNGEAA